MKMRISLYYDYLIFVYDSRFKVIDGIIVVVNKRGDKSSIGVFREVIGIAQEESQFNL